MKAKITDEVINTSSIRGFRDFNLKDQLYKYAKYWYWFLLCAILALASAYMYLRYTTPLYGVSSTLVILQEDNLSEAGLSAFKELGLEQSQTQIENEIQILKSKTLIREVVEKLKLNIQYFNEGNFKKIEQYKNTSIKIRFFEADSIVHKKGAIINIRLDSKTSFSLLDHDKKEVGKYQFGSVINTPAGEATIIPNNGIHENQLGQIIKIKVIPVNSLVRSYRSKLLVNLTSYKSTVLEISLRDNNINKAIDFIDNLVSIYEESTTTHKQQTSKKTVSFINDRLNLISKDLSSVDNEAAGYLSKFGLIEDGSVAAQQAASSSSENKKEILKLQTKDALLKKTENKIQNKENEYATIPLNLNLDNNSVSGDISRYNTLIAKRERLLKSSSLQNPVVVNINTQLEGLKAILLKSISEEKDKIQLQIKSLKSQEKLFSGQLYSAPERQKDLRVIAREQGVKEQLYLNLLEKKEEANITSHITVPNSRKIDKASVISPIPVFPNKKNTYMLALLFSFVFPFSIIYAKDLLNTSVKSKQDLEDSVSTPILSSIPKVKIKNSFAVEKMSRTPISEAFRILRTDIDFLMADVKKPTGKVIFVTSSISGEGKTFISSNIAKVLSISGNKVAYVGTDFRLPKFHEIFDLPKGEKTVGFTNFISNTELGFEDVIWQEPSEDPLDVIPPGIIPPNPSGLLMNDRVKMMFDYLEENYDYVVVDTSPSGLVTDTVLIGKYADLTVYVVRENYSDKRLLSIPEKFHKEKRLNNLAVLLNGVSKGYGNGYGYGYGYGYGKKN